MGVFSVWGRFVWKGFGISFSKSGDRGSLWIREDGRKTHVDRRLYSLYENICNAASGIEGGFSAEHLPPRWRPLQRGHPCRDF